MPVLSAAEPAEQETAKGGIAYRGYDSLLTPSENFLKGGNNKMAVFTAVINLRADTFQRFKNKETLVENLKKRR